MKKQVQKLAYALLAASLMGCGVTSEVATHHPSAAASVAVPHAEPAGEQPIAAGGHRAALAPAASRPAQSPPLAALATRPASERLRPAAAPRPESAAVPAIGAANRRIQAGRILDEAGAPLVGATVLLKGTSRGTSTDANGDYSLPVPLGTNTFVFAYSGYQDEVAQSPDGQPLTVTLLPMLGLPTAATEPRHKPRSLKAHLPKEKHY